MSQVNQEALPSTSRVKYIATVLLVNMPQSRKKVAAHRMISGRLWPIMVNVDLKEILPSGRGTTSRELAKQMR